MRHPVGGHGTVGAERAAGRDARGAAAVVPAASRRGPWRDASAPRRQANAAPFCRGAADVQAAAPSVVGTVRPGGFVPGTVEAVKAPFGRNGGTR